MLGFKGLIPRNALTAEAMQAIIKKAEEHRKISQLLIEFYRQIVIFQQSRSNINHKMLIDNQVEQYKDPYNKYLWSVMIKITNEDRSVYQATKKQVEQSYNLSNKVFSQISTQVTKLQQSLQNYREYEQSVFERAKKYYKIHKSMMTAIEQYKTSFSDVNLIYNMDEKNRRYENCEFLYNYAKDQFQVINDQCEDLFNKKKNVTNMYNNLLVEFQKGISIMSKNSIEKGKQFMYFFAYIVNNIVNIFKQFQKNSYEIPMQQVFKDNFDAAKLQYYDSKQQIDTNKSLPIILQYHALLKEQNLKLFNTEVPGYLKLIQQRLRMKKLQNKKIYDVVSGFLKHLHKTTVNGVKQILVNFEKNRKRLSEYFGNRLVVFLKSINSVFELLVGIHEKMNTQLTPVLQSLQNILSQQSKILKYFTQQINTNTQRFLIRKFIKKNEQVQQQTVIAKQANIRSTRKQISQKAEFTKHLILGFQQKMDKNTVKLMNEYAKLMFVCGNLMSQFHSFCQEYFDLYFGQKQIKSNIEKYQVDFQNTRNKNKEQYYQFQLNIMSKDSNKIIFEGDFNKIEDFKKIKKPSVGSTISTPIRNANSANMQTQSLGLSQLKNNSSNLLNSNQKVNKNIQFLKTKINFKQNQKYVNCFTCALVQKIVLQGKMYITTDRVCFHSNFNSNNLFFGKTFIQFPKMDIKKIQKKQNILDNSISFTTINGQILFTNIFSRDQVYDEICKNFNFSLDDHVYEYEQNQVEELPEFLIDNEEKDDIKISQLQQRAVQIQKIIPAFPYMEASTIQINQQSLNALKIFKLFYHNNQISYGNKKYDSFLKYYKQMVNHKDLQVVQWQPPLNQILNQSNIKDNAPLSTKRLITVTIPMNTGGVPFMPKTALSLEYQTLYFFSKHKFVIYSNFETRNAPYVDSFRLELKTTVTSNDDGMCKIYVEFYVNFVKNTMMKSVIQSKSKQQTVNGTGLMLKQMKRYFQVLHSKPKKGQKKSPQQLQMELQTTTSQLQLKKQENQKLIEEINAGKKLQKKFKIGLISSLVLNLILLLLYIFQ